jgi:hypothetical protein
MKASRTNPTDEFGLATRLLALLFGLLPITSTSRALAQFGGGGGAAAAAAEEEEEQVIVDGFEIAESNFDHWIFGAGTSDHGRKRVDAQLALQVEAIDHICGLTEEEAAKLELAGQGDIKRFYDDVVVLRAKFMKVRRNRNAFNEIYQEIQPVKARLDAGLFKQGSFFDKVLNRMLNEQQSSEYDQAEWERRQFRYHAKLELAIAMIERTMPLRAEQRERLIQVLKEETQPPKAFGQYDYYFVLYQLRRVPPPKLKPIFDEAQWKVFQQFTAQGEAMEMFLKQQGALP